MLALHVLRIRRPNSLAGVIGNVSQKGLYQLGHLLSMAIQLVIGPFHNDGAGRAVLELV